MHRREFLGLAALGVAGGLARRARLRNQVRNLVARPPEVAARNLVLTAAPGSAPLGDGRVTTGWFYNGGMPGPTLRLVRGERADVTLVNGLPEETITHWHGLMVEEAADGHPRFAIPPQGRFKYHFTVDQPSGLYWYHPHTHMRTAVQVHRGLAGLILVDDPDERVPLPGRERELLLVLQDRTIAADGAMPMDVRGPSMMTGFFGDTVLVNGVVDAMARVTPGTWRLRILNGSAARIFDLTLSGGASMTVIGSDGGFLPSPVATSHCLIAPAERVDLLLTFPPGGPSVAMSSRAFTLPVGPGGPMMGGRGRMMMMDRQGEPMPIMQFEVTGRRSDDQPLPRRLPSRAPTAGRVAHERRFVFSSMAMRHTINGREFALTRPDVSVAAGSVERWTFVNDSPFPHPVHLHAAQFLVRERVGGRATLMPHEGGWKDTVLVAPGEAVTVDASFASHRGLYLLHCHNLQHEDMGMMLNVAVD